MTLPGRLLLILTVVGVAFGLAGFFLWVVDDLPTGSYPVLMFVLPVLLGGAAFFAIGALVLRLVGVRVFRADGATHDGTWDG